MKTKTFIPGFYGKLPVVGDFISRRLPAQFIQVWDAWIQSSFSASRQQLGEKWLDVYLTSPIWRFIVSPGDQMKTGLAGLLMPSVDKVGRYFPLTLAAIIDKIDPSPRLFVYAADWFDALEQLALSALESDMGLEAFDREVQNLPLEIPVPINEEYSTIHECIGYKNSVPVRIEMDNLECMPDAFRELGICLLRRWYSHYSLWSTTGSELLNPIMLVYSGFPPANDYFGFLTGDWLRFGTGRPIVITSSFSHTKTGRADSVCKPQDAVARELIRWHSYGISDVGKVRVLNEDAFLENPDNGIWAVADGMGGHLAGDEASRAIVEALTDIASGDDLDRQIADVKTCLQNVNTELLRCSREIDNEAIMGSTVVILLAVDNSCAAIWAGDSRLYRYRNGLLSQLTRDHSPECEMEGADRSAIPGSTGASRSNIVTRALGAEDDLSVDTISFQANPGDTYLLCSDGLDKEVRFEEISEVLRQCDPEACSHMLMELALSRGARDNVTVVVVTADHKAERAR